MSVAAAGGGMRGSDDDNGGGEKQKGKGISEIPDSLPSTDEDLDTDDEMKGESKAKPRTTLDSLASLEASLPMKRGLSSHYHGKSKSFGNFTEMSMEDSKYLGKKEPAINKRRRLLIAQEYRNAADKQLRGRASSNITHASSMPAFFPDHRNNEDDDEESDYEDNKKGIDNKNHDEEEDGN